MAACRRNLPRAGFGEAVGYGRHFLRHRHRPDAGGRHFGLGDQVSCGEEFVDAVALLHDAVTARGTRVVGECPVEGYEFKGSRAVIDGHFLGLALDQHHQAALTEKCLDTWLARILPELLP